jgi:hypothetical protein
MALFYSLENAGLGSTPVVKPAATLGVAARLRAYRGTLNLAGQLITDNWQVTTLPPGALFCVGIINTTATLATSTIAIGINGNNGKYRAAAVFTAVDTPTLFGAATQMDSQTPFASDEVILGSIGVATLPGAGALVVIMETIGG